MKKKKSSILLFSLLGVAAIGIGLFNGADLLRGFYDLFKQAPEQKVAAKDEDKGARASEAEKDSLKRGLAQAAITKKPPGRDKIDDPDREKGPIPSSPTILLPKAQRYEQKVNDSSVSSRWFDQKSQVRDREEQFQKKKQEAGG